MAPLPVAGAGGPYRMGGGVHRKPMPRQSSVVVSALEVKELRNTLSGTPIHQQLTHLQREDALARHEASRERIQHWEQTVSGIRRKRLIARNDRMRQEEALKLQLDQEFAAESEVRRKACLDRAKQLQYFATDPVKGLHSKVLLYRVLEERDLQIKAKKDLRSRMADQEVRFLRAADAKLEADTQLEATKLAQAKATTLSFAQGQAEQREAKCRARLAETQVSLEEGKRVMQADREFLRRAGAREAAKRQKEVQLHQELADMNRRIKELQVDSKKLEALEEEKFKLWQARKDRQMELKRGLEAEWLERRMQLGGTLGGKSQDEVAALKHKDLLLRNEMYSKLKDEREKQAERAKEALKLERQRELKASYFAFLEDKSRLKAEQQGKDAQELQEFLRLRKEHDAAEKAEKAKALATGHSLQDVILQQIEDTKAHRQQDREGEVQLAQSMAQHQHQEEQDLVTYMKSMRQEPWAQPNYRLQKFLRKQVMTLEQVAANRPKGGPGFVSLSGEHLGFGQDLDTVRSNPIVTGSVQV